MFAVAILRGLSRAVSTRDDTAGAGELSTGAILRLVNV